MQDLISRQAAIDALRGYLVGKRCPDDGTLTCRLIENEVINKLPSVQPERKGTRLSTVCLMCKKPTADVRENVRGEWIEDNSREKSMMWRCSVCGRIAYYPTIGKRKSYKKHCGYNFCPNCGAQMRGAIDE